MKPFIQAYKELNIEKNEFTNYTAWLNGIYILKAIAACFAKNEAYPETPISTEKIEDDVAMDALVRRFEATAKVFNKKFNNKES